MRTVVCFLVWLSGVGFASCDEWILRTGGCYDWEGYVTIEREQSGVWAGTVDFRHIGGSCSAPDNSAIPAEFRAAVLGSDFFARRANAVAVCHLYGRAQGNEVRGFELCAGQAQAAPFALRFSRQ
jgi:hypothetical protein